MPKVKDGDCVSSLAETLGFRDYHTLWDDGANSSLKKDRPNPNELVEGDEVNVPERRKTEKRAVDSTWTFVVKTKKDVKLRLVLVDRDGKGVSGKQWKLVGSDTADGTTGSDGLIEVEGIPPTETGGKLVVKWTKPAKKPSRAAPPASGSGGTPPYPPAVVAADFLDAAPPERDDATVEWTLEIGSLPSFNVEKGVQARLHNLAFRCDVDSDAKETSRAVRAYQAFHLGQKDGSGKASDIEADLRDRYGAAP